MHLVRFRRVGWLLLGGLSACIPSNVVAEQDRAVAVRTVDLAWRPGTASDLAGLFESVSLTGDALRALRKVFYSFAADGTFSGAALVAAAEGLSFQTLAGRWKVTEGNVTLDDGDPARLEAAPDHLRLTSPAGVVVLRRWEPRE